MFARVPLNDLRHVPDAVTLTQENAIPFSDDLLIAAYGEYALCQARSDLLPRRHGGIRPEGLDKHGHDLHSKRGISKCGNHFRGDRWHDTRDVLADSRPDQGRKRGDCD
jgi:hypothetical protein